MKLKCFVVYDDKAKAYLPPWFLPEVGQAVRAFGDAVADPNHEFGKHPEDYSLFMLGQFDASSGRMEVEGTLLSVCSAIEVRAQVRRVAEQLALQMQREGVQP